MFRTATFKMTTKRLLLENEHLLHILFFQTLKFNLSVPLWQLYLNFIYTSLTTLQQKQMEHPKILERSVNLVFQVV